MEVSVTPIFPGFRRVGPLAAAAFVLCTGGFRSAAQEAWSQPAAAPIAQGHLRAAGHEDGAGGAPVHLTAAQDRERMLRLLGIKDSQMRPLSSTDAKAANAANYDEAKADVYPTLPNPLVLNDGQRVTTAAVWWTRRRPEIVAEFDREIFGGDAGDTCPR